MPQTLVAAPNSVLTVNGNAYFADSSGIVRNVADVDVASAIAMGCRPVETGFLPVQPVFVAPPTAAISGFTLDYIASDGATQQPFLAGGGIYNAASNTTWVTRQRATFVSSARVASVNVVNHTTGLVSSYDLFNDLEQQDGHGGAVLCRLPSGYWHAIGGVHGAPYFKYSVTTNLDDPSSFADQGNILGGAGLALTYPQPYYIDGSLYVWARNTQSSTAPFGFVKASALSSTGIPTFPTTFTPVIDMGANTRTYGALVPLPNGYEIMLASTYDDYNDRLGRRGVYIAVYNTRTGMVRNYAGTASTPAPAQKNWLDANGCLVIDQVSQGRFGNLPSIALDSNGLAHVAYVDSASYNLPPSNINAIYWTGSGWSPPQTIYSSTVQGAFNQPALVPLGGASMAMYLQTDSVFPRGGDMARAAFTPGSGWGSPSVIKAAGSYGLTSPIAVLNGTPSSRVVFGEIPFGLGAIEPTIYGGNTRRYLWGDVGAGTRPLVEDPATTAYFAQFTTPPALGSTQRTAVNDLVTDLKGLSAGTVWPKLDFLYLLANSEKQGAYVNLKPGSGFGVTEMGAPTWTPYAGSSSAGAGGLNSGFNPSSGTPSYALNSACVGVFCVNDVKADTALCGTVAGAGMYGIPRQSTGFPKVKVNAQFGTGGQTAINRADGLTVFVRNASGNEASISDGQYAGSGDSSTSTAIPASNLTLFYDNGYTTSTHQVAAWFGGGHLGYEVYQAVGNILRRYAKAIGTPLPAKNERQQLISNATFTSGFWSKGANLTVTAAVADPFGGTGAYRLQASTTTPAAATTANTTLTQPGVDPNITDGGQSGFSNNNAGSIWVRSDTAGQTIMVYDGSNYSAIPVTSTWTRVSWQTAEHAFRLAAFDGTSTRFTDIQIYGAQLDPGGTPGVYRMSV